MDWDLFVVQSNINVVSIIQYVISSIQYVLVTDHDALYFVFCRRLKKMQKAWHLVLVLMERYCFTILQLLQWLSCGMCHWDSFTKSHALKCLKTCCFWAEKNAIQLNIHVEVLSNKKDGKRLKQKFVECITEYIDSFLLVFLCA